MIMNKKRGLWLAVLVIFALVAAACGNNGSPANQAGNAGEDDV